MYIQNQQPNHYIVLSSKSEYTYIQTNLVQRLLQKYTRKADYNILTNN